MEGHIHGARGENAMAQALVGTMHCVVCYF
jgi:hypothetical protein